MWVSQPSSANILEAAIKGARHLDVLFPSLIHHHTQEQSHKVKGEEGSSRIESESLFLCENNVFHKSTESRILSGNFASQCFLVMLFIYSLFIATT